MTEQNRWGHAIPETYLLHEATGYAYALDAAGDLLSAPQTDGGVDWDSLVEPEFGRIDADLTAQLRRIEAGMRVALDQDQLRPGVIDLDRVAELLRTEHGVDNAYVEQTGGGCATLYAGPTHEQPDWGTRYAVAAGPGWFEGPAWTKARAHLGDFYIGADSDDVLAQDGVDVPPNADEDTIAKAIAGYLATRATETAAPVKQRFKVAVVEEVRFEVFVEADDEEQAKNCAVRTIAEDGARDTNWFVAVDERMPNDVEKVGDDADGWPDLHVVADESDNEN